MFSKAYGIVRNFTRPIAISTRLASGAVQCGLATFVIVNRDGWIVTAAHVLNNLAALAAHAAEKRLYDAKRAAIAANTALSQAERKKQNKQLVFNPQWTTNVSHWWCDDKARAVDQQVDLQADVAIARLENVDLSVITQFPVFHKSKRDPMPGTSLCRMGFPFVQVTSTFNEQTGGFTLQNFNLPPMFPNDGIHTRIMQAPDPATNRTVKFIETSTPGLMGQSGGPLFDVEGQVWGIQSRTNFLELGFSPRKKDGVKEIVEHQFMNVGLATHVEHVFELFDRHGVAYQSC